MRSVKRPPEAQDAFGTANAALNLANELIAVADLSMARLTM
jgi:hypothetical protein